MLPTFCCLKRNENGFPFRFFSFLVEERSEELHGNVTKSILLSETERKVAVKVHIHNKLLVMSCKEGVSVIVLDNTEIDEDFFHTSFE